MNPGAAMLLDRVQTVKAFVNRLTAKWRSGPPVEVVATPADLPVPAPPDARGLFWRHKVFIVAAQPNCRIAKTLAHEAVAHHGLRALLGAQWHHFMQAVHRGTKAARDRPLRRLGDKVRRTYVNKRGRCDIHPLAQADGHATRHGVHRQSGHSLHSLNSRPSHGHMDALNF